MVGITFKKITKETVEEQIGYIRWRGAYCTSFPPYIDRYCKGCKLIYDTGQRKSDDAKCKMNVVNLEIINILAKNIENYKT